MNLLQINLFGRFQLAYGEQNLTGLETRKTQELLCYLLVHRSRPHSREALADLLWSGLSASRSRSYLRKSLWQLQTILDTCLKPEGVPLLLVDTEWIELNNEADFWLDIAIFEQAFINARGIPGSQLDRETALILQNIVSLYRGELLEGWYLDWCLYERERFQYMYLGLLDKLMNHCEAHQNYEHGITYGLQALGLDPARERTHRRLMRLKYLAGHRTEALRQYESCVAVLEKELGVSPSDRTIALFQQIQVGESAAKFATIDQTTVTYLPQFLHHLQQIEEVLTNVQRKIQQEIQSVKRVIDER